MLTFRIPIDNTNARHLYRHLLRETSYLPPIARPWITSQIRDRFRRHADVPTAYKAKLASLRQTAYYSLRYLRGAVVGDPKRVLRILFLVFGRKGKRRRILVSKLLLPSTNPKNLTELDKLIAVAKKDRPERMARWGKARQVSTIMDKWDIQLLRAMANSQVKQPDAVLGRLESTAIKHASPRYDKVNLWGKPHSERRIRYIEARHWKTVADRLLPPVEEEEWALLERLATQTKEVDPLLRAPKKRRTVAKSQIQDGGPTDELKYAKADRVRPWHWRETVDTPVDLLERQRNRRLRVISGARRDGDPRGTPKPISGMKPLSGRAMRRLLLAVWEMTPKIVPRGKPGAGQFSIIWGGLDRKKRPEMNSPAAANALFSGVDSSGRVLAEPTSQSPPPSL